MNHKEYNLYRSLENIYNPMVNKMTMKTLRSNSDINGKEVSTIVKALWKKSCSVGVEAGLGRPAIRKN